MLMICFTFDFYAIIINKVLPYNRFDNNLQSLSRCNCKFPFLLLGGKFTHN